MIPDAPTPPSRTSRIGDSLRRGSASGWAAHLAALLGAGAYGLQAWGHSHGQASVLDEGLYLYKGFLYASGRYWPFQDFGPWTNHMPLAFLIPGWIQRAVEPGLRTGRLYALALSALFLLAVWILGRRVGGRWWGAGALFMLAANPFLIKIYSQAISQVLVAGMLAWALVFTLGAGRPRWQLLVGAALGGALIMIRVNVLPALPLLLAYVFWQHGSRAGRAASAVGLGVVLIGHVIFWPGVLKIWAYWLPDPLTPFLNPWRELSGAQLFWNPESSVGTRMGVFLSGFRLHLFPWLGVLLSVLCWPRKSAENLTERREAGLLLAIFFSLLGVHAWAALGRNYCVFCYPLYQAFFSFCGILLLALALGRWFPRASETRRVLAGLGAVLVGLLARPRTLERLASLLLSTQLPRMKEQRLLPGTASIEVLLVNRFNLAPPALHDMLESLAAIGLGFVILGGLALLGSLAARRRASPGLLPWIAVPAAVWLGWLSLAHGNTFRNYDCGGDVVGSYEAVGAHLQRLIPAGASVYWAGGLSPVPLLYLPQAEIFPAQLNGDYSFRIGGEPASLERFGFWNAELAETWLQRAEYALVEQRELTGWLAQAVGSEQFEELSPSPPAVSCRPDSWIHVYRRVK